jgi:hypothetical protein
MEPSASRRFIPVSGKISQALTLANYEVRVSVRKMGISVPKHLHNADEQFRAIESAPDPRGKRAVQPSNEGARIEERLKRYVTLMP